MATELPSHADPDQEPPRQEDSQLSSQPQPQPRQQQQAPAEEPTPGPRAARLKALYGQALHHTLNRLAWDNLAACYPTVASRAEPVLRQVQSQMVGKLGDKCAREFDSILAQRGVVAQLNELERLLADAATRRSEGPADPEPPHLLPPERILAAHMTPALAAHQSQLNARLQTTQSQNALLHDEVRRQQVEIDELVGQLEAAAGDVRGANAALAGLVEELAAEARDGKAAVEGRSSDGGGGGGASRSGTG